MRRRCTRASCNAPWHPGGTPLRKANQHLYNKTHTHTSRVADNYYCCCCCYRSRCLFITSAGLVCVQYKHRSRERSVKNKNPSVTRARENAVTSSSAADQMPLRECASINGGGDEYHLLYSFFNVGETDDHHHVARVVAGVLKMENGVQRPTPRTQEERKRERLDGLGV